jgi:predicted Rossmann fold flavoprotein
MTYSTFDLIVIGGGAAGFFGAIQAAEKDPGLSVLILEKSTKLLAKVKVSGGGRCNVTHNCFEPIKLSHHYPRGEKQLKQIFKKFHAKHTVDWFAKKGVELKTEEDGRMFPATNTSQTIIDCFLIEAERLNIKIETRKEVDKIVPATEAFKIICQDKSEFTAAQVLVASGGHSNFNAYRWLEQLGHVIHKPIPSLFTFNDSLKEFKDLMGVAVNRAEVKIAGTKLIQEGPVLITHWGLSGPAVIKLSAWAAEYLHRVNYEFTVLISWIGPVKEEEFRTTLAAIKTQRNRQKVTTNALFGIPQRLWQRLCEMAEVEETKIWAELPQRNFNKLVEFIIRCPFHIKGKTTFKEEFVTCGGIDLKDIDPETLESKKVKNLFFAGEVLNIDGETGGFNFQAAWSTAYVAAGSMFLKIRKSS